MIVHWSRSHSPPPRHRAEGVFREHAEAPERQDVLVGDAKPEGSRDRIAGQADPVELAQLAVTGTGEGDGLHVTVQLQRLAGRGIAKGRKEHDRPTGPGAEPHRPYGRRSSSRTAPIYHADQTPAALHDAAVVGGKDEGRSEVAIQLAHDVKECCAGRRVEVGRWLVREHQGGAASHRANHRHPLLLAARQLARTPAFESLDPRPRKELADTRATLLGVHALEEHREFRILEPP